MISPLAFVDPSAIIGENVTVHPFAYIDKNVVIGNNNVIMPYASVLSGARIGDGNTIYQGAVISAVPQDFNFKGEETIARLSVTTTRFVNTPLSVAPLIRTAKPVLEITTSSCRQYVYPTMYM